jgi:hypothetical protein
MMDNTTNLPTLLQINQLVFDSMLEIMGPQELSAMIQTAFLPVVLGDEQVCISALTNWNAWVRLQKTMLDHYDGSAAAGITIRVGQVLFKNFQRCYGSATLLENRAFAMLPKPERIYKGLQLLASLHCAYIPELDIVIEQDDQYWYWKVEYCGWSARHPQLLDLLTKLTWGLAQEFLSWTGGGKQYPVHEDTAIIDNRPAGTIAVQKKYID